MKNLVSFNLFEGKAEKASKNPYGSTGKEDKKDQLRKSVEDHIKTKECKTKKVGDDFEIHCDGEHIGQVMFRDEKITVKKQGEKFGKEFKYNELGKIKAEVTSVIKDCKFKSFNESLDDDTLKSLMLLQKRLEGLNLDIDKTDKETLKGRITAMTKQVEIIIEKNK